MRSEAQAPVEFEVTPLIGGTFFAPALQIGKEAAKCSRIAHVVRWDGSIRAGGPRVTVSCRGPKTRFLPVNSTCWATRCRRRMRLEPTPGQQGPPREAERV